MTVTQKTTKKQFDLYVKECKKWIKFFGLSDWDITFLHKKCISEDLKAIAACSSDVESRSSILILSKEVKQEEELPILDSDMKVHAFHEVVHLLMARYGWLARSRNTNYGEIDEEEHAIVARLQNSIFK